MSTRRLVLMTTALTVSLAAPVLAQGRDTHAERARQGQATGVMVPRGDSRADGDRDECDDNDRARNRDRDAGSHDWNDADGRRDRHDSDCNVVAERRDGRYPARYDARSVLVREHAQLLERLEREHEQWHREHGWVARNPGWERAHAKLHERLEREHERFHRSRAVGYRLPGDRRQGSAAWGFIQPGLRIGVVVEAGSQGRREH